VHPTTCCCGAGPIAGRAGTARPRRTWAAQGLSAPEQPDDSFPAPAGSGCRPIEGARHWVGAARPVAATAAPLVSRPALLGASSSTARRGCDNTTASSTGPIPTTTARR
jgi:hypothetical protein